MEYQCEYCKKSFLPKRTDSLYCSHSCRQLAYVLRKATLNGSSQGMQAAKVNEMKILELSSTDEELRNYLSENQDRLLGEPNNLIDEEHLSSIDEQINQTSRQVSVKKKKELSVRTDTDIINTENKLSVKTDILVNSDKTAVNTDKELAVRISGENLNPDKKIPVRTNNENVNTEKQMQKISAPEYKEYSSRYINELDNIHNEKDNWIRLDNFFGSKDDASFWVSEKYRCLVECLLMFSETKQIELNDLKEVCNAFIRLIQSRNFKCLHPSYPYIDEIRQLKDRIKNTCIKAGNSEWLKYKLSKEQKQNMIITRLDLSQFVPKRKFSELNFKEK